MGKISIFSSNEPRTLVLVGRTGNGKSSTGNSILGRRRAFTSRASSSGVTRTCELKTTVLKDGQSVNVIDTPGLFATGNEFAWKEIVKCVDMAKDGIHAIVLVLSVKNRFSEEEGAAIRGLQDLFGSKIVDYMIVVFTGGDELEDNDETLEDYLGRECPEPLKEILTECGNRYVLFDNKTKNETKRVGQVQQLLSLVNTVISQNGGRPYTNELKKGAMKLRDQQREADLLAEISELKKQMQQKLDLKEQMQQMHQKHDEELKRIAEMVESKKTEENKNFMRKLAEEQAAKYKAEENAKSALNKIESEIQKLKEDLAKANRRNSQTSNDSCAIL